MKIDIATQSQMNEQILLHLNAAMDELKTSLFPCRRYAPVPLWYMRQRIIIFSNLMIPLLLAFTKKAILYLTLCELYMISQQRLANIFANSL